MYTEMADTVASVIFFTFSQNGLQFRIYCIFFLEQVKFLYVSWSTVE